MLKVSEKRVIASIKGTRRVLASRPPQATRELHLLELYGEPSSCGYHNHIFTENSIGHFCAWRKKFTLDILIILLTLVSVFYD